ncbi:hypothetical protein N9L68_01825 [bacterium]|nr:hypothetical protein [bacterium]
MGATCCRRRATLPPPWAAYCDRAEEHVQPTTARERRMRPSATSLSSTELERYAIGATQPRRAEGPARELERRKRGKTRNGDSHQ